MPSSPTFPSGSSNQPASSEAVSFSISALITFEQALLQAGDAYRRWCVSAIAAVARKEFSHLEIAFLLDLAQHAEHRTFAQLCKNARVEEPHLAHYALRKLQGGELVEIGRRGREKTVILTDRGIDLHQRFARMRLNLMGSASTAVLGPTELLHLARMIRLFAGVYDEARRSIEA